MRREKGDRTPRITGPVTYSPTFRLRNSCGRLAGPDAFPAVRRFRVQIVVVLDLGLGTGLGKMRHFADALLHFFARLERDYELVRHIDTLSRAGIPRLACLTLLNFEHAEVPQLDPADLQERVHNRVECLLNDVL